VSFYPHPIFNACLSKNIKISTFEKASKSSHFRSDNQCQISLDSSHTCRNRKRLISLINFATLYFVRRQASREYSMYAAGCSSIHGVCPCIRGVCPCIQGGVPLSSPIFYMREAKHFLPGCSTTTFGRPKHESGLMN
jgi:hypothetical protein